ncbi:MAG: ion transporter [Oscillatoriales cyanobacterium]|nr:MAG: ion transporter [Oscillatoriales cyanobacterium]
MASDFSSDSLRRPPLSEFANEISVLIRFLIVLSVVTFVAATFPLEPVWFDRLRVIDGVIAVVFLVEYAVRFWRAHPKLAFVGSLLSAIDAIVLLELTASLFGFPIVHGLRGVRVLRLLRFLDVDVALFRLESRDRLIFARILFTLIAIVSLFAGLIYEVEYRVNPEDFGTVLDAIYFAVVTMTTVGFGDMTPATSAGRLLTMLMILTGVALIPWQIGQLIEHMVKSRQRVTIVCGRCGCDSHDRDARFCKQCGTALDDAST